MKYGKQFWINKLGKGWAMALKDILKTSYGTKLMDYLITEYSLRDMHPEKLEDVFAPFKTCKWEDVKVVIVTTEPHAFVRPSGYGYGEPYINMFHSSRLAKLYEAIERTYYTPYNTFYFDFDFSLESWAKQGILLLNLSPSLRKNEPGSHQKPWNKFVSEVLNQINEYKPGTIFLLLGERPRKLKAFLNKNHYILEDNCPGVYADLGKDCPSEHFLKIDELIETMYNEKINW